ncbi:putative quinol monooxygenase [Dyadobacter sp. CY356]|uniref:putative quinol monooxygenase n=1 Tax=Dyadobacter sp. CY356 TaxID=2906442 RepID=UPI001F1BBC35|nr:antibiotic biosynthesis monooxygenase [Dyadobacter sp. CY356]MCF0057186.1 antibiotic biosynthesis monooxygenase [Dyadobacter sp. CY356]
MGTKKVITNVTMVINAAFIEQVLLQAKSTREQILQEEGCETFILNRKIQEPNTLVLLAIYQSEQAYNWHNQQTYVKDFFAFLKDRLKGTPVVEFLQEI